MFSAETFGRPKLVTETTEGIQVKTDTIVDDTSNSFYVDFYVTITADDESTSNRLLYRTRVSYTLSSKGSLYLTTQVYKYDGSAPEKQVGSLIPTVQQAVSSDSSYKSSTIDLDAIYTAAGDLRK